MSNWSENPMHQKQSLMNYALPPLLFQECQKYCVEDYLTTPAETPSQKQCIANCQDKTYKAFDMYMLVQQKFTAKKTYKDYIDISRFTEMEIEHGHDTASQIPHTNERHVQGSQT